MKKQIVALFLISVFTLGSLTVSTDGASTITIDQAKHYQTIDGFGSFSGTSQVGAPGFFHDSLGASIVRLAICGWEMQSNNNMTDSTNSDITKFAVGGDLSATINVINSLKGYGDVKFIATSWTPPAWMKDMTRDPLTGQSCVSGANLCGGHLSPKYYESFAGLISGFCKIIKARTGVDIFAVNFQNEPWFIEWYVSCVVPPTEYVNILKVVGARLKKDGLPTMCFGAEDMVGSVYDGLRTYASSINADATALSCLYAYAVHGYTDGVHPVPSSSGSTIWTRAGNMAVTVMKKKLWMSEMSGFDINSWSAAMNLGSNLFMSLKYGQLSGWTYWTTNDCGAEGLLCNSAHTMRSLVSKNYYKFIRPGAVAIGCVNTGDTLYPVAFAHTANKTLSIVIVNQATTARTLTLSSGTALPASFEKYTTTSTKKCVDEGSVAGSGTITIDANSVTTLFGQNYTVDISHKGLIGNSSMQIDKKEYRYFRLDGSSVKGSMSRSRGVYIKAVSENGSFRITPVAVITK
jgi:O-glycosyl hydrolase